MGSPTDWRRKELWHRRASTYCVEVSRHEVEATDFDRGKGLNRWAVYAYLYPTHPRFALFSGSRTNQPASDALPLHCGPTYLRWHRDDAGVPTAVQVGADYDHLYDDHYSHCATPDDAFEVFRDAAALFAFLAAPIPAPEVEHG